MHSLDTSQITHCPESRRNIRTTRSLLIWPAYVNPNADVVQPFPEGKLSSLRSAMQSLTPKQRRTLALRHGLDDKVIRSDVEISKIEGITKQAVRKRIAGAMKKLKKNLI